MFLLLWLYSFCARLFPLKFNYFLAALLGKGIYYFDFHGRKAVLDNLRRILPAETPVKKRKVQARNIYINFQKYLFEYFALKKYSAEQLAKKLITFSNTAVIDNLLKERKSFIFASSHLGNWELAGKYAPVFGGRVNIIYRPFRDERLNTFFSRYNHNAGLTYIPLGMSLRKAFKALKQGEIVALLGDWGIGGAEGIEVRFFGEKTRFPLGPATLAVKAHVPLVPGFMMRTHNNQFEGFLEEPIYQTADTLPEQQIQEMTQRYATILEKYVRQYPDQWLIFTQVWTQKTL